MKLWKVVFFILSISLVDITVSVGNISHEIKDPNFLHRKCESRHHKHLNVGWFEVIYRIHVTISITIRFSEIRYHFDVTHSLLKIFKVKGYLFALFRVTNVRVWERLQLWELEIFFLMIVLSSHELFSKSFKLDLRCIILTKSCFMIINSHSLLHLLPELTMDIQVWRMINCKQLLRIFLRQLIKLTNRSIVIP